MIIRGGENVYPREIEEFLYTHPDIEDVQVIGVPDEQYGEELMAWIKPVAGASLPVSQADLHAWVKAYCAKVRLRTLSPALCGSNRIPHDGDGKIRKVEMREMAIAELDLQTASRVKHA